VIPYALMLLVGASTRARGECRPAAIPHGDPQLVRTLIERLAASGIETAPDASCPAVRVQVAQRGAQVHLRVTDAYERLGERDVQDVATAAAIIETWTLQEIEPGTLPEAPIAPPSPKYAPRTGLAVAAQTSLSEQATTWAGGSVSGCMMARWSCLGATVHASADVVTTPHDLFELDALATADLPWALGRFVVSPGIALGYGWQRVESHPLDGHGLPTTVVEANHSLRAGLHLRAWRSLSEHFAIYAELAVEGALARTGVDAGPTTAFGLSLGARVE